MVDDIFIGVELPEGVDLNNMKENISFEVYLDGEKINTTQQSNYLFSGLNKGKHKAGVKAVFSSVTTPMTEIEFDVEEGSGIEENQLNGRTIHPNPAKETVTVSGEYDYLSIFDNIRQGKSSLFLRGNNKCTEPAIGYLHRQNRFRQPNRGNQIGRD